MPCTLSAESILDTIKHLMELAKQRRDAEPDNLHSAGVADSLEILYNELTEE